MEFHSENMSFKKVFSSFKTLDIFGHPVDLYFEKQNTVKSNFGAIITLCIIGICVYLFILNVAAWSNLHDLQIISSSQSFSGPELSSQNKSMEYQLDYLNYNIYFGLAYQGTDGTFMNYKQFRPKNWILESRLRVF